ncbi:PA2779 family protein [bacterium]|nr:PA2779 family protein [bacterium]
MELIRTKAKFVSIFMALLMFLIAVPCQSIFAAMIATDVTFESARAHKSREDLKQLIAREDVERYLIVQGIDPVEINSRIDSLTDAELIAVADQIEQLPAGGNGIGVIVGAALIVFLVLLVTDILGYTDIFPFVKAQK